MSDLIIPLSEAAAALGISRQFAWQLMHKGKLPAVRVGKRWFVAQSEVMKRLEVKTRESKNEET